MGIAAVGSAETLYLTMVNLELCVIWVTSCLPQSRFLHAPLLCLASGCDLVVNSVYSEIYGVPISLLGKESLMASRDQGGSCN